MVRDYCEVRCGGSSCAQYVYWIAGEHDASLDRGEAYQEFFRDLHYLFDHKGVHFIVLDNVSDPMAAVGEQQLLVTGRPATDEER